MKFKSWLNENDIDVEPEFLDKIKKDCQPYLKLLKKSNVKSPLFRGMNNRDFFGEEMVRKNRQPSGTSPYYFPLINKLLKKKGFPSRSESIIATFDKSHVSIFGSPYFIFPKGNFKYAYFKGTDFNWISNRASPGDLEWKFSEIVKGRGFESIEKDTEVINKSIDILMVNNKNLLDAYKKGYEIWVDCNEYYYISARHMDGYRIMDVLGW